MSSQLLNTMSPQRGAAPIEVQHYRSPSELRGIVLALEAGEEEEPGEILLVLDERFTGDLTELVTRQNSGGRLTLVALSGRGTRLLTTTDIGWRQIALKRDLATAVSAALSAERRILILWPAPPVAAPGMAA